MRCLKVLSAALLLSAFVLSGGVVGAVSDAYAQSLPQSQAAQQSNAGIIQNIVVQGNQRIEDSTVLSYLSLRRGDPFDPDRINDAIKSLFATGLFNDVVIGRQGGNLIIDIKENLIVNKIAFEGNDKFKDDALVSEVSLKPRQVYTVTKVKNDVQRLLDVYQKSGRFGARVEPKIIKLERNRVNVVFEIEEGKKTKVQSVNFIGNKRFSDRRLKDVILTKEAAFWRFLTATDTYDPDRLSVDEELLRQFYLKRGYADFRVLSSVGELLPSKDGFVITITMEEGEVYKFGKITIESELEKLKTSSVRKSLKIESGKRYNAEKLERSIEELKDVTSDLGFAFVDIKPQIDRDEKARLVNINFKIEEGAKVYVERINIKGNVRTHDNVIRREFRLIEGDAFSVTKLRQSKRAIEGLPYFARAEVTPRPGSAEDKATIDVDLEEQSTGAFEIGAGFSTAAGAQGQVKIGENNLLGKGYSLSAEATISADSQKGRVSFSNPYFRDRPVSAGVELFYDDTDFDESDYTQLDIGATIKFGYQLSENLRQNWSYTWKRSEIENSAALSGVVANEPASVDRSDFTHQLIYTDFDSLVKPTDGQRLTLTTVYAGIGGEVNYLRNVAALTVLRPLPIADDWGLKLAFEGGILNSFDSAGTLVSDRFSLGESKVRGFDSGGIGPRITATGESLRGTKYYAATAELRFPLPKVLGLELTGRTFVDAGSLWDPDTTYVTSAFDDDDSLRVSAGAGFTWVSPIGPLAFDFGYPLQSETYDDEQVFRFSGATRF